jgi:hypothetical protein
MPSTPRSRHQSADEPASSLTASASKSSSKSRKLRKSRRRQESTPTSAEPYDLDGHADLSPSSSNVHPANEDTPQRAEGNPIPSTGSNAADCSPRSSSPVKTPRRPLPVPPIQISTKQNAKRKSYQPSSPFFSSKTFDVSAEHEPSSPEPVSPRGTGDKGPDRTNGHQSRTPVRRRALDSEAARKAIEADERGEVSLLDFPRPITVYDEESLNAWAPGQPRSVVAEKSWVDGAPDDWEALKARSKLDEYLRQKEEEEEEINASRESPPRVDSPHKSRTRSFCLSLTVCHPSTAAEPEDILETAHDASYSSKRRAKLHRRSEPRYKRKPGPDEFFSTKYVPGVPKQYIEPISPKSKTTGDGTFLRSQSEGAISLSILKSARGLTKEYNTTSSSEDLASKGYLSALDRTSNSTCSTRQTTCDEDGSRKPQIGSLGTKLRAFSLGHSLSDDHDSCESNHALFNSEESGQFDFLKDSESSPTDDITTYVVRELRRLQRRLSHELRLLYKVQFRRYFSLWIRSADGYLNNRM